MAAVGVTVYFSSKLSNTPSLPFSSFFPSILFPSVLAIHVCMYAPMYTFLFPCSSKKKKKEKKAKRHSKCRKPPKRQCHESVIDRRPLLV